MEINKRKLFEFQPKQPKGITLIALVITIIVMLILAGVSINMLVGDNGVLKQGQNAKEKHAIETYRERIGISVVGAKANLIQEPTEFFKTVRDELKKQTEFNGASYSIKNSNRMIITTKEDYIFVVEYPKGTVKYLGKKTDMANNLPATLEEAAIDVDIVPSSWTNGNVKVTISCNPKYELSATIEYSYDLSDWKTYEGEFEVKENKTIYVRLADDISVTNYYSTATISIIDKKKPDITTEIAVTASSITTSGFIVTFSAQDTDTNVKNASGLSHVQWYYKKLEDENYNTYGGVETIPTTDENAGTRNITNLSKTFSGLQYGNGKYNVYAKIYDKAGNEKETEKIEITLKEVNLGTYTVTPAYWTNQVVTVTLPTINGLITQYANSESNLNSAPNTYDKVNKLPISSNCDIYYRLCDGTNSFSPEAGAIQIRNIDTTAPTIETALSQKGTPTSTDIVTTIKVKDTGSGFSHINWYYKKTSESSYKKIEMTSTTHPSIYKAMNLPTTETGIQRGSLTVDYTFSGLQANTEYSFYAEVYDVAGNMTVSPPKVGETLAPITIKTSGVPVTGITLNSNSKTMGIGETYQLTATVTPNNATNKTVTWSSNNPSVATVDANTGKVTVIGGGTGTATITATAQGGTNITAIFTIILVDYSNLGTAYNYSVTVNGQVIDDWKIFWKDSGGTFIITSDYLKVSALGTGTNSIKEKVGLTTTGTYVAYWSSAPTSQIDKLTSTEELNLLSNYHQKYNIKSSSNDNAKCVSTLLNTENWEPFVDSAQGAKYAIGGPTLEMWMSSWNEKTKNDTNRAVISCQGSGTGYQMKIDSKTGTVTNTADTNYDNYLEYTNMNKTDEYNKVAKNGNKTSLYYPYTVNTADNCWAYWFASPSAYNGRYVCGVTYLGDVTSADYINIVGGLRPVVYIQN